MNIHQRVRIGLVVAAATLFVGPALVSAQTAAPAPKPAAHDGAAAHDGQRDFDFLIGTWKTHLKRLVNPLTGSTTWIEFEGTQVTEKSSWGGRAIIDEFSVQDPKTNTKVEGLTVRLYNPASRQWSIYWANAKNGAFSLPPTVGRFTNGRGEFYDQEEFQGRWILVRYVWSDITPTSAKFEQSFSEDGGKTWEANWISTIARVK